MPNLGKILILMGLVFIAAGILYLLADRLPLRVGRLPGDIVFRRGNFTFYFPWVTSILISVILTLLFWIFGRR